MDAKRLQAVLESLGACAEAVEWSKEKSLAEAWASCERADWMLWLLGKQIGEKGWPDRRQVVSLACLCAETALKFVPAGEDRPRKAIETARAWCEGKATLAEVRAAASAAYAASAASAAYAASAASAAYAAYAASAAYTAYAASDAARRGALKDMAEMIRHAIPSLEAS